MSWLPKGTRPTMGGWYHMEEPLGGGVLRSVVLVDTQAEIVRFAGAAVVRDLLDRRFGTCRFAPATPPPGWDLVEALEGEKSRQFATEPSFNAGYFTGVSEALKIARAYLAREEESPCPTA